MIQNFFCSCVSTDQCEGNQLLNVRGAEELTCEDTSQICCHKTALKVTKEEKETPSDNDEADYYDQTPCSSVENEGYRYTIEAKKLFISSNKFILCI